MRGAIPKKEENFTGKSIHEYIFVIWKKAVMICSVRVAWESWVGSNTKKQQQKYLEL